FSTQSGAQEQRRCARVPGPRALALSHVKTKRSRRRRAAVGPAAARGAKGDRIGAGKRSDERRAGDRIVSRRDCRQEAAFALRLPPAKHLHEVIAVILEVLKSRWARFWRDTQDAAQFGVVMVKQVKRAMACRDGNRKRMERGGRLGEPAEHG